MHNQMTEIILNWQDEQILSHDFEEMNLDYTVMHILTIAQQYSSTSIHTDRQRPCILRTVRRILKSFFF